MFAPFTIAAIATASLCLTSCATVISNKVIEASKNTITDTVAITGNFTGVSTSHGVSVVVETGKDYSITVTGPDNVVNIIETTVTNGTLNIGYSENVNIDYGNVNRAVVTVTMPAVKSLSASGQSTINIKSRIDNDLAATTSGQATIHLKDVAGLNDVTLSSSGQSTISAQSVKSANTVFSTSGQATLNASSVKGKSVTLTTSGQSNIKISVVDTDAITADASGQSVIRVIQASGAVRSYTSGQASISIK